MARDATAWTGNDARVVEYGEDELATGTPEPLFDSALEDGVELFGSRRALRRLITAEGVR